LKVWVNVLLKCLNFRCENFRKLTHPKNAFKINNIEIVISRQNIKNFCNFENLGERPIEKINFRCDLRYDTFLGIYVNEKIEKLCV